MSRHKNMVGVILYFDNVDIYSYFNLSLSMTLFSLTSLTPSASPIIIIIIIIINIITISGSYILFFRLNFACQGNPLFDIFIWSNASLSQHRKNPKFQVTEFDEERKIKLSVNTLHLCVGFALNENRYSSKRIKKNQKL